MVTRLKFKNRFGEFGDSPGLVYRNLCSLWNLFVSNPTSCLFSPKRMDVSCKNGGVHPFLFLQKTKKAIGRVGKILPNQKFSKQKTPYGILVPGFYFFSNRCLGRTKSTHIRLFWSLLGVIQICFCRNLQPLCIRICIDVVGVDVRYTLLGGSLLPNHFFYHTNEKNTRPNGKKRANSKKYWGQKRKIHESESLPICSRIACSKKNPYQTAFSTLHPRTEKNRV